MYITGHGLRRNARRHFLTLPDTEPDRLHATAFPTSELITAVLDSESEHVLVLVDSCFSGTLRSELSDLLEALSVDRYTHQGTAVVTAGNYYEQPLVGSFTQRVVLACERMRDESAGYTASHLSFAEWEQLLDQVGRDDHGKEKDLVNAEWIVPHSRKHLLSACLPNPRYQAPVDTTDPALRQLALTSAAEVGTVAGADSAQGSLADFWLERASGRATVDDPGWYFSGRAEPMAQMINFLGGPAGVLIVTGAAGSGKSALLSRLVTLSDRSFVTDPRHEAMVAAMAPEVRPKPGSVDIAVLARNKSAREIVDDLLAALGDEGAAQTRGLPLQALLRRVSDRADSEPGPATVVIDALDEADDPLALVNDVILPLARLRLPDRSGAVRLLLGIRSSPAVAHATASDLRDERTDQLLRRLSDALATEGIVPRELRSDGPDCEIDIAAYVATLLLEPEGSPYQGAPKAAAEAAGVIAEAVAPSFLDARIAADQLRRAEARQDLIEEGWLGLLADGTTGLLREDIRAVSLSANVPVDLLVAALRATAFAPGAGLPWAEVWPAVTAALVAPEFGIGYVSQETADHAIRTLRSSRLTGYLAIADEDARTVYRPVHQRLTDLLVSDHDWLLAPLSATTSRWWRPTTGPQVLVAAHAAITEALARLVWRPRPHLAHPYIRRHFLHHAAAGEVLADRGTPLELLAQETSGTLRARLGLPLPTADPERRTLAAAAIIEPYLDDSIDFTSRLGSIVFHASSEREPQEGPNSLPVVPVWSRWAAPTNVLASLRGNATALCVLPTMDGRSLVAVDTAEGRGVRIWDAASGERVADLDSAGRRHSLRPIRTTGGRTFLVALDAQGVGIYDPTSGQPIAAVSLGYPLEVHVLEDGFALWKLFIRTDSHAFLWRPTPRDMGSGTLVEASGFPPVDMRLGDSKTAVVRRASGHALVAVATAEGVRLWDPVAGLFAQPPFGGTGAYTPVAVVRTEEDDLLLVRNGSLGRRLEVWNPFTGVQKAQVQRGGHGAVALPGGRGFARAVGSRIVLRDLETGTERSFDADVPTVDALAVSEEGAALRIVSAGLQGVRIWDLDGEGVAEPDGRRSERTQYRTPWTSLLRREMWPLCRAQYPRENEEAAVGVLVLGRPQGLDIHDAATGKPLKRLDTGHVVAVQPLPSVPGTALVAVTGLDSWSIWDLASENPVTTMRGWKLNKLPSCIATTPEGLPIFIIAEGRLLLRCVVWNPDDGEVMVSTLVPDGEVGWEVAIGSSLVALPPGDLGDRVIVAVVGRRDIALVDVASGDRVGTLPLSGTPLNPRHLCTFSAEGRVLLAASTSAAIHVWDTDGTPLATCDSPDTLAMIGLDLPDGRTLLASGDVGGVRIWDPWTGDLRHTLLTGAPVHAMAADITPTGTVLHIHGPAGLATVSVNERLL
ncbi:AAA family ATPase [Streptomyces sp. NPDC057684]|uniref:AAA family ATPase n=1 Tax=Streptomyces sp. NPDC057684 TaxID=3346211 RepID=UPI0036A00F86